MTAEPWACNAVNAVAHALCMCVPLLKASPIAPAHMTQVQGEKPSHLCVRVLTLESCTPRCTLQRGLPQTDDGRAGAVAAFNGRTAAQRDLPCGGNGVAPRHGPGKRAAIQLPVHNVCCGCSQQRRLVHGMQSSPRLLTTLLETWSGVLHCRWYVTVRPGLWLLPVLAVAAI